MLHEMKFYSFRRDKKKNKSVIVARVSHLLMFLHCGIELLGQIIGYIWHSRLFLIGSTDAALVFVGFLVILLFGILAVSLGSLVKRHTWTFREVEIAQQAR